MNKKVLWGTVLALSVGVLGGVNIYQMNKSVDVELVKVEEGSITEHVYASGKLESVSVTHYFMPLTAAVSKLDVKVGAKVKKGQTLLTLQARELEQQLQVERNNLRIAERELTNAQEKNLEASDNLFAGQKTEIDLTPYELRVENAKLVVDNLEKKLANSKVVAKNDGVVTELSVKEGQMVPEGTLAVVITDPASLQVRANLSEVDASKVKLDSPVVVTGDAFTDTYDGKVSFLSPLAAPAGPTSRDPVVEMIVTLNKKTPELRPGYNAAVDLPLPQTPRILAPLTAVKHEGETAYVLKVENNQAVRVDVKTGKEDEEHVEILEGLNVNEEIIEDATDDLKPGKKVQVKAE